MKKLMIENQNKPGWGDGSEGKGTAAKGQGPDLHVFNSLYISDIIITAFLPAFPPINLSNIPESESSLPTKKLGTENEHL